MKKRNRVPKSFKCFLNMGTFSLLSDFIPSSTCAGRSRLGVCRMKTQEAHLLALDITLEIKNPSPDLDISRHQKKKKVLFCLELQTACLRQLSLLAQTRCLSYWDEEIPVSGHSWENPLLFSLSAR